MQVGLSDDLSLFVSWSKNRRGYGICERTTLYYIFFEVGPTYHYFYVQTIHVIPYNRRRRVVTISGRVMHSLYSNIFYIFVLQFG